MLKQSNSKAENCFYIRIFERVNFLKSKRKVAKDPWMGLFADEPELVDQILEEALRNRAEQSFNQTIGQGTA